MHDSVGRIETMNLAFRLIRATGALAAVLLCAAVGAGCRGAAPADRAPHPGPGATADARLTPSVLTDTVPHDPDDPALWIHPTEPGRSLILATDKETSSGGLFVLGMDGRIRQAIVPLDRPNNVDVEYAVPSGREAMDIAVVTERNQRRLRVFSIRPDGSGLDDEAPRGVPVLAGAVGTAGEPMGIALYRRERDGAVFAIVAPKSGPATDYLWQYRLEPDEQAGFRGTLVRRFGAFSGVGAAPGEAGEIEAIVVDDELGYVYYADERHGLRKWHADPDHPDAGRELAVFGTEDYAGDREGLAIYARSDGTGYLVSSDQVPGATRVHVYPREGAAGSAHQHPRLAVLTTEADETDGLDVVGRALPGYPEGILVMMNSGPRNFLIFDWRNVSRLLSRPAARQ